MDGDQKKLPARGQGNRDGRKLGAKNKLTKQRIASALDILAELDGQDGEKQTARTLYQAAFKDGQYAVCFAILKLYREHGHGRPAEMERPAGGAPAAIFVFNAARGQLSGELKQIGRLIDQPANPS